MSMRKRHCRKAGMLQWDSHEHFRYFHSILTVIRRYNPKTFIAVWREVISAREKNKPHLSLMIYQIHNHIS